MNVQKVYGGSNQPDACWPLTGASTLPPEALQSIFEFLQEPHLNAAACVNRTFHASAIRQTEVQELRHVRTLTKTLISHLDSGKYPESIKELKEVVRRLESLNMQTVSTSRWNAVKRGLLESIQQILDAVPSEALDAPFDYLDQTHRMEFAEIILRSAKYQKLTEELRLQVYDAAHSTTVEQIQSLLQAGALPTDAVLTLAVENGKGDWLKLFLESGAIPQTSLLGGAILRDQDAIVSLLVEYGIQPDAQGWLTALCISEDTTLKALVSGGVQIPERIFEECITTMDWNKVCIALSNGLVPTTRVLNAALSHGCSYEVVRELLNAGAEAETESLEIAVGRYDSSDLVELLRDAGAYVTGEILSCALRSYRSANVLAALIGGGVLVKRSHLLLAIQGGHPLATIRLLVNEGAVPGEEAIKLAVSFPDSSEMVDFLRQASRKFS